MVSVQEEFVVKFTESAKDVLTSMADRKDITEDQMFRICLGMSHDILKLGRRGTTVIVTRPNTQQTQIHLDDFDALRLRDIGASDDSSLWVVSIVSSAYDTVNDLAKRLDAPVEYAIQYSVALVHTILDAYQYSSTVRVHLPWWKLRRIAEIDIEAYFTQSQ